MTRSRHIRWNHLHLEIPEGWEGVVKGDRHLILEAEFRPLLELRWHPGDSGKRRSSAARILSRLDRSAQPLDRPELTGWAPESLRRRYRIQAFSLDNSPTQTALLLTCNHCAAVILVRLYAATREALHRHPFVLESLCCHPERSASQQWQIQDFFFWIPDGFELSSWSFRFGLTALQFKTAGADLALCRLAPASQHLQRVPLPALFETFCGAPSESQVAVDERTLRYRAAPTPGQVLWGRIRRKKPYQSAGFSHFPAPDRILGYRLTSSRPLADNLSASLENGYGLVG